MATAAKVEKSTDPRAKRVTMTGVVTSDKRDKTITVQYEYSFKHPKYGKYMRRRGRVHAHDESNEAHEGDRVQLASCRPYSKTKSWRLLKVLEHNPLAREAAAAARGKGG